MCRACVLAHLEHVAEYGDAGALGSAKQSHSAAAIEAGLAL